MIYNCLYCLVIFYINGLVAAGNANESELPSKDKPEQPNQLIKSDQPRQELKTEKNQSNQTEQSHDASNSKCKPYEILTVTKGCVNREEYLRHILENTWTDEYLDAAKSKAGFERTTACKEGEVLTVFGCAPEKKQLRTNEWERPTILHSHMFGNKVFKSSDGVPEMDKSKETSDKILGTSLAGHQRKSLSSPHLNNVGLARNVANFDTFTSDRTLGHNRPRSYVFMPGRKLRSHRKCRPYEVLARNNRCIRKRGETGLYKHKDHEYGKQIRHRHTSFEGSKREN